MNTGIGKKERKFHVEINKSLFSFFYPPVDGFWRDIVLFEHSSITMEPSNQFAVKYCFLIELLTASKMLSKPHASFCETSEAKKKTSSLLCFGYISTKEYLERD